MANKRTRPLTIEEFHQIDQAMHKGGIGFRPNDKIATALALEANLGIRIEDILDLSLNKIVKNGNKRRLNMIEKKTGKQRNFVVPKEIYTFMVNYCNRYGIAPEEKLFPFGERHVQKYLATVVWYLDLEDYEMISTHSYRKLYGTTMYYNNGKDIELVRRLFNHSSTRITQTYIGVTDAQMENAIENHTILPER